MSYAICWVSLHIDVNYADLERAAMGKLSHLPHAGAGRGQGWKSDLAVFKPFCKGMGQQVPLSSICPADLCICAQCWLFVHEGLMLSPPPCRNVEDVCRFPDLPARKQLTYQAKQLIAHEIEMEKMRRTEAVLQARNLSEVGRGREWAAGGYSTCRSWPGVQVGSGIINRIVKVGKVL